MKSIETLLEDFTDYELAVFYTHKRTQYLPETQSSITSYVMEQRGLDTQKIAALLLQKPELVPGSHKVYCPNCHTNKLIVTRVQWILPAFRHGYEERLARLQELATGQATYKDKVECFVCGYILFDPNNRSRSFWQRVRDIFYDNPLPF